MNGYSTGLSRTRAQCRERGAMGSYEEFPAIPLISTLKSLKKRIAAVRKMTMNLAGGPGTPEEYQWKR